MCLHLAAQNFVHVSLIAFSPAPEPSEDIRIDAQTD
jgi:hypothetical protein